jgi:hypothetical protein
MTQTRRTASGGDPGARRGRDRGVLNTLYGTTRPYDPFAGAPPPDGYDVAFGMRSGATYTAIFPVGTPKGERATLLGATAVTSSPGVTLVRLAGVTHGRGLTVWPGPGRVAVAHESAASVLRPVRGMRFAHGPQWLGTHVWLAMTFRVLPRSPACLDLPQLRLRYRVGGSAFSHVVHVPMRFRLKGSHADCAATG